MDFVSDESLKHAETLMANLWELCDQRLDNIDNEGTTNIEKFNDRIADAINVLCEAFMIVNLNSAKEEPTGFVSYSKQTKRE